MTNIITLISLFVLCSAVVVGLYYLGLYIYSLVNKPKPSIITTTPPVFITIPDNLYIGLGPNANSFGILNNYNWFNHLPNGTLKSVIIVVNKLQPISPAPVSLYAAIIDSSNVGIYVRKIADTSLTGQIVINPSYKASYSTGECFYDTPNLNVNDTYTFNFKVVTDAQDCNIDISTYITYV